MKLIKNITFALLILFAPLTMAQGPVAEPIVASESGQVMEFFHGDGCPHCAKQWKWIPTLMKMYPDLQIKDYEVWKNPENQAYFNARMAELGAKAEGVPTNVINGQDIIVGFRPEQVLAAMQKHYGDPAISAESLADEPNQDSAMSENVIIYVFGVFAVLFLGGIAYAMRKK